MKYFVITHNSAEKLGKDVETWLKNGWTLQGGVSVAMDQGQHVYAQAMIKESK